MLESDNLYMIKFRLVCDKLSRHFNVGHAVHYTMDTVHRTIQPATLEVKMNEQTGMKCKLNTQLKFNPNQCYKKIKEKYLETGELFEDDEFVAGPAVLTDDAEGQTIVINYLGKRHVRRAEIEWLRPGVGWT